MSAELSPEPAILSWMQWADQHGLWDMISTFVLVISAVLGFALLFWAKRRVRNLNFFVRPLRDEANYPLKVYVEIRNYTGRSVVISVPYFVYSELRSDPNARGDSPAREYEKKFPDPRNNMLSEVEYLLRHRENVSTWVPIDPAHTDEEVAVAIERGRVGKLHCMCTWLQRKAPSTQASETDMKPNTSSSSTRAERARLSLSFKPGIITHIVK